MRMWAPQGVAPEHARRLEVAREGELPGRLGDPVHAADALADPPQLDPLECRAHRLRKPPLTVDTVRPPLRHASADTMKSGGGAGWPPVCRPSCRRRPHRIEDLLVTGAAAKVARERLSNVVLRGLRLPAQKIDGGHHEARRTEAALDRSCLHECFLNRVGHSIAAEALDGHDLVAIRLRTQHEARTDEQVVQEDGARATLALLAGVLGPGQPEALPQDVEQALARPDIRLS